MRKMGWAAGVTMLGVALGGAAARADGDAGKGEKVFAKCKTCHEIATTKNKVGPTLHGVIGRKAGTVEGFKYSEAMTGSGVQLSPPDSRSRVMRWCASASTGSISSLTKACTRACRSAARGEREKSMTLTFAHC